MLNAKAMNRVLLYVVIPLVAAAASALNLVRFWLDNLMRPSWPALLSLVWWSAFVVIVAALILAVRSMEHGRRAFLAIALVVIVAAGFAPRIVELVLSGQQQARDQAEGADIEMEFQSAYLDRSEDVQSRIAAHRTYTAEEALDLLDFAATSDLSWHSLPDHTAETFALVKDALAADVLDPNALATPATADSPAVTLTLLYWEKNVRPGSPGAIEKHAWDLLQMLVAAGADLSSPDAAPLRADLAKTVVPGEGRFVRLE
jgi:hypothetical protein